MPTATTQRRKLRAAAIPAVEPEESQADPLLLVGNLEPIGPVARRYCGRDVSAMTLLQRWVRQGISDGAGGRIKLAAAFVGNRWLTTDAAFREFVARRTVARLRGSGPVHATAEELQAEDLI